VVATVKIPQVPQNSQIFSSLQRKYICGWDKHINCALQALRRAWIASNGAENLESACLFRYFELAEKGPICVSSAKCLSRRSQVRRLSLVYRSFLPFEKGLKFPLSFNFPGTEIMNYFLGILSEFWPKSSNFFHNQMAKRSELFGSFWLERYFVIFK
jgi:hypothetical protein